MSSVFDKKMQGCIIFFVFLFSFSHIPLFPMLNQAKLIFVFALRVLNYCMITFFNLHLLVSLPNAPQCQDLFSLLKSKYPNSIMNMSESHQSCNYTLHEPRSSSKPYLSLIALSTLLSPPLFFTPGALKPEISSPDTTRQTVSREKRSGARPIPKAAGESIPSRRSRRGTRQVSIFFG
jgi:hypothetical protein